MIEIRWVAGTVLALVLATLHVSAVVVPDPPRMFGISAVSDPATITTAARQTSALVQRPVDVINIYKAWVWQTGLPTAELAAIRSAGAVPEITWEPWDPNAGTEQGKFSAEQIVRGDYDTYISHWAAQAKAWGSPLYLRFAHEMNGTWYPWAFGASATDPAAYVAAYAHVHHIFTAAGADNVRWVWSPHVMPDLDVASLAAAYPGPDLVDVVGIDGYVAASNTTATGWADPAQVFGALLTAVAGIAPGVPVWVNETGCDVDRSIRAGCTTAIIDYFRGTTVRALLWFDIDDGRGVDWRLAADPDSSSAARTGLRTW